MAEHCWHYVGSDEMFPSWGELHRQTCCRCGENRVIERRIVHGRRVFHGPHWQPVLRIEEKELPWYNGMPSAECEGPDPPEGPINTEAIPTGFTIAEAEALIRRLAAAYNGEDDVHEIGRLADEWVKRNPEPKP
ncbi:MAG TPA: hypothetical protein VNN25_21880 [Thermoanaerobaculia bacterium]|nr:hypothetical protein [Thermoanaerobaculia bacterium]